MKNNNFLKLFICCILIILLGYTGKVHSEPAEAVPEAAPDPTSMDLPEPEEVPISEAIGKQDPFKMVEPVKEPKKKLLQAQVNSQEGGNATPPPPPPPELFVKTVMLKFLQAANVERVITNLTSSYGAVATDSETNSIIISDTKEKVEKIVNEIRKADQTPRQIMVEVVIVDVQLNDTTELGVNWTDLLGDLSADVMGIPGIPGGTHSNSVSQSLIPSSLNGGATLHFLRGNIGVTLKALQQVREVELLANPKIMVLSGQEATIKTVEEIPYSETNETSAGGSMTQTEFKEAGVTLIVKATLTDEGKILIAMDAEQSVNTGINTATDSEVPIVDTRSAQTTLLMEHDQVIVLGGLRKKETRISNDKVPLLGDLPIVGFLFSDDKTEVKKTELLIFISPHISINEPPSEEEMKRFNELREAPMLEFKQEKNHPRNPLGIMEWFEE